MTTTISPLPADLAALKRNGEEILAAEKKIRALYTSRERALRKAHQTGLYTPSSLMTVMGLSRTRLTQMLRKINDAEQDA
jgi:hypothetical protein